MKTMSFLSIEQIAGHGSGKEPRRSPGVHCTLRPGCWLAARLLPADQAICTPDEVFVINGVLGGVRGNNGILGNILGLSVPYTITDWISGAGMLCPFNEELMTDYWNRVLSGPRSSDKATEIYWAAIRHRLSCRACMREQLAELRSFSRSDSLLICPNTFATPTNKGQRADGQGTWREFRLSHANLQ